MNGRALHDFMKGRTLLGASLFVLGGSNELEDRMLDYPEIGASVVKWCGAGVVADSNSGLPHSSPKGEKLAGSGLRW